MDTVSNSQPQTTASSPSASAFSGLQLLLNQAAAHMGAIANYLRLPALVSTVG
jgi:hypothetical protein